MSRFDRYKPWLIWGAAIVGLVIAVRLFHVRELLQHALDWTAASGPWGPAIFTAVYILATVLLVPGSMMTVGAGAVFGLLAGMVLVSLASTLAATVAFLVGRYLVRSTVARRIENNDSFAAIDRAVAAEGWKIVLLTRLSPVFPYTLLNYAFGLTRVKLGPYVLASWIGMLPGTAVYVYFGTLANIGVDQRARTMGEWALYGVGLVATIAVTVVVTRIAKDSLARKISDNATPALSKAPIEN